MGKEGLQILTSILYLTVSGLLMSSSKVATSAGLEPTNCQSQNLVPYQLGYEVLNVTPQSYLEILRTLSVNATKVFPSSGATKSEVLLKFKVYNSDIMRYREKRIPVIRSGSTLVGVTGFEPVASTSQM